MRIKNILLGMCIILMSSASLLAQCKLTSGEIKVLKGQSIVNLQYDYSKMAVGKYKNEQDYITKKTEDMNKHKPGSGDEWARKWVEDRATRFQPMFEKNLNKEIEKFKVTCQENASDAKYTLIVRTTFTEPGYNVGVSRKNAYISLVVDLVETANPSTVIGSMLMKNEQSINMMGYDYDTGERIVSCYDRAGEHLGSCLAKNAFKK
jgi:hypothetical protein